MIAGHYRIACGLAAVTVLGTTPALGAGFYIADVGARGMGRGGAFVAAPDSLLAANYNPAGLSLLRGLHVEASLAYVELNGEIQRSCPCLDAETDATLSAQFAGNPSTTSTPLAIPFFGIGYGFDWMNAHIALAGWGPNSGRHSFGEIPQTDSPFFRTRSLAQPQRYAAFEVANFEANFTLNAAMELLPGLRIGVGGYLSLAGSDQSLAVWANSATFADEAEDTRFDVPIEVQLDPVPGFRWGVGVSYEILPGLSIGGSYLAKRTVKGNGKLNAQLPVFFLESFDDARIEGDEVEIELDIAPIARMGLEYKWPEVLTVEAAVVWEGWSSHDRIDVRPQNVRVTVPLSPDPIVIPDIELPRAWSDTWSFRLGGEVHLLQPYVDFRWGYFYETSAVPADTVSAARIDRPKHGGSLGAAVTWQGVTLEVSATYVHLVPLTITDSDIRVVGVFPTEPDEMGNPPVGSADSLSVVGNGDISAHYLIGAVSLGFSLDAFSAD